MQMTYVKILSNQIKCSTNNIYIYTFFLCFCFLFFCHSLCSIRRKVTCKEGDFECYALCVHEFQTIMFVNKLWLHFHNVCYSSVCMCLFAIHFATELTTEWYEWKRAINLHVVSFHKRADKPKWIERTFHLWFDKVFAGTGRTHVLRTQTHTHEYHCDSVRRGSHSSLLFRVATKILYYHFEFDTFCWFCWPNNKQRQNRHKFYRSNRCVRLLDFCKAKKKPSTYEKREECRLYTVHLIFGYVI